VVKVFDNTIRYLVDVTLELSKGGTLIGTVSLTCGDRTQQIVAVDVDVLLREWPGLFQKNNSVAVEVSRIL
jgi:hypothetical protein